MSIRSRPATASIAAEPVSPEVAPTIVSRSSLRGKERLEQAAEQLQRDVLERQRRAVEQFQQPVLLVELHQRRHRIMGEAAIGRAGTDRSSSSSRQAVADEGQHHLHRQFGIGQARHRGDLFCRKARPFRRHIEPAIGGQAGQGYAFEIERRCAAASGDILHGGRALMPGLFAGKSRVISHAPLVFGAMGANQSQGYISYKMSLSCPLENLLHLNSLPQKKCRRADKKNKNVLSRPCNIIAQRCSRVGARGNVTGRAGLSMGKDQAESPHVGKFIWQWPRWAADFLPTRRDHISARSQMPHAPGG